MARKRVIIMGAAGRDFHNFNVYYRDNEEYEVVAFTATQIPGIDSRLYPPELAGRLYPNGIPIYPEDKLPELIKKYDVDEVAFAYSDVSHEYVMHRAAIANSLGASFILLGPKHTMLKSKKPVIAICAVRTGCGKSPTSRKVMQILRNMGYRAIAVRHPMPYDPELNRVRCERIASFEDLEKYRCTIEEREEYEGYLEMGAVLYAGVDYPEILRRAEEEADVIIWDGGNNDYAFFKADLYITVVDPLRAGNEYTYYPGEVNLRMADVVIINKVDSADAESIHRVRERVQKINANAIIIEAASPISVEDPAMIRGKRVLVIEDGPTLTHGEMQFGAGYLAAKKFGASEIVDPRPYAVGSIKETFERYKHLERILPAMGYGEKQIKELEETIKRTECDVVVSGTPIDLRRIIKVNKPVVRVRYELQEIGRPNLEDVLSEFVKEKVEGGV